MKICTLLSHKSALHNLVLEIIFLKGRDDITSHHLMDGHLSLMGNANKNLIDLLTHGRGCL